MSASQSRTDWIQQYLKLVFLLLSLVSVHNVSAQTTQLNSVLLNGAAFCSPDPVQLCITAEALGTDSILLRLLTVSRGWVAFGIGSSMANADIVVAWTTNGTTLIVSDRMSTTHSSPPADPQQDWVVNTTDPIYNANGQFYMYTMSRKLNTGDANDAVITNSVMNFIWAVSNNLPVDPTNQASDLGAEHSQKGVFQANLFVRGSTAATDKTMWYVYHGMMMILAWPILASVGMMMARYGKQRFGASWFRIHVGVMVFVILITIGGGVLAYLATPSGDHFSNIHRIIGSVLVVAALLQGIYGQVINRLFDAGRLSVPLRDKLHWGFGYLLWLAAAGNCYLGITFLDQPAKGTFSLILLIVLAATAGIALISFIVLQFRVGQIHHENEENEYNYGNQDAFRNSDYDVDRIKRERQQKQEYSPPPVRAKKETAPPPAAPEPGILGGIYNKVANIWGGETQQQTTAATQNGTAARTVAASVYSQRYSYNSRFNSQKAADAALNQYDTYDEAGATATYLDNNTYYDDGTYNGGTYDERTYNGGTYDEGTYNGTYNDRTYDDGTYASRYR